MTGHIISLHGDLHDDACALLPWYVTGQLDDADTARIKAHLPLCAQCQADLAGERRWAMSTPVLQPCAIAWRPDRLKARILKPCRIMWSRRAESA
jgi:anti-sigma factor RsiW